MNFCRDCRWLSDAARGKHWTAWTCVQAVNDEINPVNGEIEPYQLCRFARHDLDCPVFESGHNCLHPKPTEEVNAC